MKGLEVVVQGCRGCGSVGSVESVWILGYKGLKGVGCECLGSVVVCRVQGGMGA